MRCLWGERLMTTETQDWRETLYASRGAELLLYGRALGLSHAESEDVIHEVFVSLFRLNETPRDPAHYLLRAFRHRALNHRRSLLRRLKREWESIRWFERSSDESEKERAAMRCLETLPVEQREVIVLKIWHEYTFEQIGGLLELSPNTVAGRYRYGLQKLRTCLRINDYEQFESRRESAQILDSALSFGPAAEPNT